MSFDPARLRLTNWSVKWATVDFGLVDRVTPNIELVTKEMKAGSIGDVKIGEWVIGLTGTITVELRELDVVTRQKLSPWWTTGSISLNPTTYHQDLYAYAALLTLHPLDVAAATHTQDLNLLKAVPKFKEMEGDGNESNKIVAEFEFYPDRTQLLATTPLLVYGYIGDPPP
jgi:hypothetical protein